jgi:16S rRNA A1518/A1519 N6-dimethyltransferase RsmA/KsgA/DIM1 with predicted DNA glycosylase/AP lyase activity
MFSIILLLLVMLNGITADGNESQVETQLKQMNIQTEQLIIIQKDLLSYEKADNQNIRIMAQILYSIQTLVLIGVAFYFVRKCCCNSNRTNSPPQYTRV